MLSFTVLVTAFWALMFPLAQCHILFINNGTFDDWQKVYYERNGFVNATTHPDNPFGTALHMIQRYDPITDRNYNGGFSSYVERSYAYVKDEERFYGIVFRLGNSTWNSSHIHDIVQFASYYPEENCTTEHHYISSKVWIQNGEMHTRITSNPVNGSGTLCSQSVKNLDEVARVEPNDWHKLVIHAVWSDEEKGLYRVWLDNELVVERLQVSNTIPDEYTIFGMRVGLDAVGWRQENRGNLNSTTTREIWIDRVVIGTRLIDVDFQKYP